MHDSTAAFDQEAIPLGLDRITNANQRRLARLIHERPGLNGQELSQAIGVTRTAINYHIRRLCAAGFVVSERQGSHLLHFPHNTSPARRRALALLRLDSVRVLATAAYHSPQIRIQQLAVRSDMNPRTLRRALHTLRHHDLVRCEKNGHAQVVHLHPELRIVLARWAPPEAHRDGDAPDSKVQRKNP